MHMGKNDLLAELLFQECMEEVFVFREDGQMLDANPVAQKETGYGEELLTCNIIDIFPQIFEKKDGQIRLKTDYPVQTSFNAVAYCKNQVCYPVKMRVWWKEQNPCHEFDSVSLGVCVAGNISYLAAAQKRIVEADELLENTNQMRNEFVANLTHELRTPVNGISGLANDLKKTNLTDEQREDVDVILHCCSNMTVLISQLLDFSKMEAGKLELEERRFSLKELLDKVVAFYQPLIRQKRLRMVVNIAPDLPDTVIGDGLRLEQVFHNLLSNAVKFTSEGYVGLEVLVTTWLEDSIELFVRVIDTGIGIPEEKRDQLFLSFTQLDGSVTRKHGGTGLGLSISKQLVAMMNGTIRVDSEPGTGSIFSFAVNLKIDEMQARMQCRKSSKVELPVDCNDELRKWMETKEPTLEDRKKRFMEALERMQLSIQMENRNRAEEFAEQMKALVPEEEKDLWRAILRIQMDVRKADYERATADTEVLLEMIHNNQELKEKYEK